MSARPRRRHIAREAAAAAGVAALVVAAGIALARLSRLAVIGEGYVAKQGCSCVFLNGRDLEVCRDEMPLTMHDVRAVVERDPPGVRAWLAGLGAQVARYHDGSGCTLE